MDTIGITVDCSADDYDALAGFCAAALGYERVLPGYLVDPKGRVSRSRWFRSRRSSRTAGTSTCTSRASKRWRRASVPDDGAPAWLATITRI